MSKFDLRRESGRIILLTIFIAIVLAIFAGCDMGGGITIPSGATNLSMSMKSDENVLNNPLVLTITEAKSMITGVGLEKPDGTTNLIGAGVFVMNFNLDGTVKLGVTGYTVRDIYTKIKFQLHKPDVSETPSDPEFKDGPADNQRYSFIVKGIYNGNPFVYKSKSSADVVINLDKQENIDIATSNITLLFNNSLWFKNSTGYVDPSNALNETLIDDNLKTSFKRAFRDDNQDGQPDN